MHDSRSHKKPCLFTKGWRLEKHSKLHQDYFLSILAKAAYVTNIRCCYNEFNTAITRNINASEPLTFLNQMKVDYIDVNLYDDTELYIIDCEQDIFISFRGTETSAKKIFADCRTDLSICSDAHEIKTSTGEILKANVHRGFYRAYASVHKEIKKKNSQWKTEKNLDYRTFLRWCFKLFVRS